MEGECDFADVVTYNQRLTKDAVVLLQKVGIQMQNDRRSLMYNTASRQLEQDIIQSNHRLEDFCDLSESLDLEHDIVCANEKLIHRNKVQISQAFMVLNGMLATISQWLAHLIFHEGGTRLRMLMCGVGDSTPESFGLVDSPLSVIVFTGAFEKNHIPLF